MNRNRNPVYRQVGVESNCGFFFNHRGQQQGHAARKIEPAINHMWQHVNEPLRISILSAVAGVSASHFFWLFKSVTGCTPIRFFIRLRMHRACELLRNQNLSVKETAFQLGYDDPYYFSRMFKLVMGVAPRDYRNGLPHSTENLDSAPTDSGKGTARYSPLSQFVPFNAVKHRAGMARIPTELTAIQS